MGVDFVLHALEGQQTDFDEFARLGFQMPRLFLEKPPVHLRVDLEIIRVQLRAEAEHVVHEPPVAMNLLRNALYLFLSGFFRHFLLLMGTR